LVLDFLDLYPNLEESNIITADIETGEVAVASFDGLIATLNSATITYFNIYQWYCFYFNFKYNSIRIKSSNKCWN
jgi:hypothetical protein